ncbi:hypothetical protein F01_410114 [Burkholderia cenocepacia]|nr:hypothetical protein F01_410114 [Burkholderia cenocepacia]
MLAASRIVVAPLGGIAPVTRPPRFERNGLCRIRTRDAYGVGLQRIAVLFVVESPVPEHFAMEQPRAMRDVIAKRHAVAPVVMACEYALFDGEHARLDRERVLGDAIEIRVAHAAFVGFHDHGVVAGRQPVASVRTLQEDQQRTQRRRLHRIAGLMRDDDVTVARAVGQAPRCGIQRFVTGGQLRDDVGRQIGGVRATDRRMRVVARRREGTADAERQQYGDEKSFDTGDRHADTVVRVLGGRRRACGDACRRSAG